MSFFLSGVFFVLFCFFTVALKQFCRANCSVKPYGSFSASQAVAKLGFKFQ